MTARGFSVAVVGAGSGPVTRDPASCGQPVRADRSCRADRTVSQSRIWGTSDVAETS